MKTFKEYALTEAEQARQLGAWAKFKMKTAAKWASANVSKTELKSRMKKGGIFSKLAAGITASLFARGGVNKQNDMVKKAYDQLMQETDAIYYSTNMLNDMIKTNQSPKVIKEHAMNLRESAMAVKKSSHRLLSVLDEYRRLGVEDKEGGALSIFSGRELDRYDFDDFYKSIRTSNDIADMASKAATAAGIGQYKMVDTWVRGIKGRGEITI